MERAFHPSLPSDRASIIALLIIIAVAGKSALLPFSGWLPRAMEGPTPSSAVYYGALSIHAGCYLLMRAEPLLRTSTWSATAAALAGATTAVYAALVARVQTDVKSALAYASLTQVGVIVTEIAFGWTTIAFVHLVGHTCFRLLQFLRAPNFIHELHELNNRVGRHAERPGRLPVTTSSFAHRAYLCALERGFVDALAERYVIAPLRRLTRWLDRFDRVLSGSTVTNRPEPVETDD